MAKNSPRAILFDVGGVLVVSPFQAILDYERANNIPESWINFAISRSGPNGHWQRLERGEIKLDEDFFQGFKTDLQNREVWRDYQRSYPVGKKRLKELADPSLLGDPISLKAENSASSPTSDDRPSKPQGNNSLSKTSPPAAGNIGASQLGDPVSLKAGTANSSPTEQNRGVKSFPPSCQTSGNPKKSLAESAKDNITALGDPVSLKAEQSDLIPTHEERGQQSSPKITNAQANQSQNPESLTAEVVDSSSRENEKGANTSQSGKRSLSDLAKANPTQLGDPVSLKAETASSQPTDQDRGAASKAPLPPLPNASPSPSARFVSHQSSMSSDPPNIDSTSLFWSMMGVARTADPDMGPALKTLSRSNRFILGGLSNNVDFPPDHPFSRKSKDDPRSLFDVFIASAEVGLRKPQREIYELALRKLDELDKRRGGKGIKAEEVVFLDDIGENLKTARVVGMRTIRVELGNVPKAVAELEAVTGEKLRQSTAKL